MKIQWMSNEKAISYIVMYRMYKINAILEQNTLSYRRKSVREKREKIKSHHGRKVIHIFWTPFSSAEIFEEYVRCCVPSLWCFRYISWKPLKCTTVHIIFSLDDTISTSKAHVTPHENKKESPGGGFSLWFRRAGQHVGRSSLRLSCNFLRIFFFSCSPFSVDLLKHSHTIALFVALLLKEHEVNKEDSPEEGGLHPDIKVAGEGDAKVVCVSECLLCQATPLLAYLAYLHVPISWQNLELHIPTDAVGTTGSLYAQDYIIRGIAHCELRLNDAPLLLDWSNDSAWWRWHLKALKAAREATGSAGKGAVEVDHFILWVVKDLHVKGTQGTTAVPGAAVCVLSSKVNLLAHWVLHLVLIGRLKPSESFQKFHLLFDQHLVKLSEVFKAWRTVGHHRGWHPPSSPPRGRLTRWWVLSWLGVLSWWGVLSRGWVLSRRWVLPWWGILSWWGVLSWWRVLSMWRVLLVGRRVLAGLGVWRSIPVTDHWVEADLLWFAHGVQYFLVLSPNTLPCLTSRCGCVFRVSLSRLVHTLWCIKYIYQITRNLTPSTLHASILTGCRGWWQRAVLPTQNL